MNTYNAYLTKIALRQSGRMSLPVYKVRAPRDGEQVIGYVPTSDFLYKPTLTEECLIKNTKENKNDN